MMRRLSALALALVLATSTARAGDLPFGSADEVAYAGRLWQVMEGARMVGADARELEPFYGGAKPHGMILELVHGDITVDGHTGFVVVKKNYDGEGVSEAAVARDRARFLSSITVMYRREAGYDPENQNWFWVKYKPGGGLFEKDVAGAKVPLAGRIVKGKSQEDSRGCIYCHASAGGGDYIFYPRITRGRR